jgi:hypothetical protein
LLFPIEGSTFPRKEQGALDVWVFTVLSEENQLLAIWALPLCVWP